MKKKNVIITSFVLILGLFLSLFVLYTPMPNTTDETTFNSVKAMEYIAAISQDQHSVYDPIAHEEVRVYLRDTLGEFIGTENVTDYDYDKSLITEEEIEYDIHNLLGVIEGTSETGILLVAHYDSRGHIGRDGELGESYGAADDGYGVATLLEIARLYGNRNVENSIYILLTDAEETGLYGAMLAAQENDIMDNIGFVINIEARGVTGPAYMFETSTNNAKVIDFYAHANMPVSYSLATAVYTVMPNSTDFTEFLAIDKEGINFAVLNGLEYYHTPFDNYTNIDASSIQHYGEQIVPLVEEFTTNSAYSDVDYFVADSNQVFFTLFTGVFIHYPEAVGTVLHIVLLVLVLGIVGYLVGSKRLLLSVIGKGGLVILGSFVAVYLLGSFVSRIVAFISKVPYNMTYVRTSFGGIPTLVTLVLVVVGFVYVYQHRLMRWHKGVLVVGTLLNLVLALATGLILSGASFLFLVAGFTGTIVLGLDLVKLKGQYRHIIYGILMVLNLLVVLPIVYSLYLAITVGGLFVFGIILLFYLVVLVPMYDRQLHLY